MSAWLLALNWWLAATSLLLPMIVFAAWAVAIVGPAAIGGWAWRSALTHFDRLVGRPHRAIGTIDVTPCPPRGITRHNADPTALGFPLAKNGGPVIR